MPKPLVTMRPVLKTISSPASNVSEPFAAEFKVTIALLSIVIVSPANALLPAVNTVDAPTVTLALIVSGLFAARKPPPPAVEIVSTLMPPARSVIWIEPVVLKPSRRPSISRSPSPAAPMPPLPAASTIRPLVADKFKSARASNVVPSTREPLARISMAVPVFVLAIRLPRVMFPPKFPSDEREIVPVST